MPKAIQVGDSLYEYEIIMHVHISKIESNIKTNKVLGINQRKLVLNDDTFTVIDLKKEYCNTSSVLNKSHFFESRYGDTFDIYGYVYTENPNKEKAFEKLKKNFEKWLDKKYSIYFKGTELLKELKVSK